MDLFATGPALLFCPADRPDRYAKAAERADAVVLDLEDAVAAADKEAARAAVAESRLDPERTIVRVNAVDSEDFLPDLEAVRRAEYSTVMVPKAADPDQLAALAGFEVVALCETAAGIVNAAAIAAARDVVALMWGAEDLLASLDGTSSRTADGTYRQVALHARSSVLLAAAAHGKGSIDSVYLNLGDLAGLAAEAEDAVASGFTAKACIHPSHVAVIRNAYRPPDTEVEEAVALLKAARHHGGVFRYEGRMVDEPLLRHARHLLRRARRMQG